MVVTSRRHTLAGELLVLQLAIVVLVLTSVATGDPHAAWPLYQGKIARGASATAYACRGYACDEPTTDPRHLAEQVTALGRAQRA